LHTTGHCRRQIAFRRAGIPPTHKTIATSGVTIARFADGKIVEGRVSWDALGMLQLPDGQ
jgi:ketosteroid isomerase-like protein